MRSVIQAASFQRARLPLVAVAAFALGAFAAASAPHLSVGAASVASVPSPIVESHSIASPLTSQVSKESGACGHGAYVTGDIVGDASPAEVYAALCGKQ